MCIEEHPLSDAEYELAYDKVQDGGPQLFIAIGGYGGSSTRIELAAAIIVICTDGPVHMNADSAAFRNKALKILRRVATDKPTKHSWKFKSVGDFQDLVMPKRSVMLSRLAKSRAMLMLTISRKGWSGHVIKLAMTWLIVLLKMAANYMGSRF